MSLPLILAGPILRRVSSSEVWVWFASSMKFDGGLTVEMEIYDTKQSRPSEADLLASNQYKKAVGASYLGGNHKANLLHAQVLENLHVYLVRAVPRANNFPTGEFLLYEIYIVEDGVARYGFSEHKLHKKRLPIKSKKKFTTPVFLDGYCKSGEKSNEKLPFESDWRGCSSVEDPKLGIPLPRFVIQNSGSLNLWAGSCFKPHGYGESATNLMYSQKNGSFEGQLIDRRKEPDKWPHALCLLGDQIYADDISFVLFEGVKQLAGKLEPNKRTRHIIPEGVGDATKLDTLDRRALVLKGNKYNAPFSIEPDELVFNHLLTLPEFCAYHLMHVNAAMWPTPKNVIEDAKTQAEKHKLARWTVSRETERLTLNRAAVRDYSTVLANVPTYCMLDDHEITDDFMIDAEWIKKILPDGNRDQISAIGQFVVSNGLAAYAAFQGVGNDPAQLHAGFIAAKDTTNNSMPLLSLDWSHVTPTTPPIIFLDTRTTRYSKQDKPVAAYVREYFAMAPNDSSGNVPLNAIKPDVWLYNNDSLRKMLNQPKVINNNLVFICTPSPLLSSESLDRSKRFVKNLFWNDANSRELDAETWRDNPSNFFSFVEQLFDNSVNRCICISGDVHYSYYRTATIAKYPINENQKLSIEQVVASPLLNEFEDGFGQGNYLISEKVRDRIKDKVASDDFNGRRRISKLVNKTWMVFWENQKLSRTYNGSGFAETSVINTDANAHNSFLEIELSNSLKYGVKRWLTESRPDVFETQLSDVRHNSRSDRFY